MSKYVKWFTAIDLKRRYVKIPNEVNLNVKILNVKIPNVKIPALRNFPVRNNPERNNPESRKNPEHIHKSQM